MHTSYSEAPKQIEKFPKINNRKQSSKPSTHEQFQLQSLFCDRVLKPWKSPNVHVLSSTLAWVGVSWRALNEPNGIWSGAKYWISGTCSQMACHSCILSDSSSEEEVMSPIKTSSFHLMRLARLCDCFTEMFALKRIPETTWSIGIQQRKMKEALTVLSPFAARP